MVLVLWDWSCFGSVIGSFGQKRNAAVPLAGRSRGLLAVQTGSHRFSGIHVAQRGLSPFGESAIRVHFGGHVTRFGGSADFFGSPPPTKFLREPRRSSNPPAAFGPQETRSDPSPLVSARSRKRTKSPWKHRALASGNTCETQRIRRRIKALRSVEVEASQVATLGHRAAQQRREGTRRGDVFSAVDEGNASKGGRQ